MREGTTFAIVSVCLVLTILDSPCAAFSPSGSIPFKSAAAVSRNMVDPVIATDVGIAVVSAAAGAASQFPRINQLQRELDIARTALTQSEQELVTKITQLEDRLYEMDAEFEAQTTKFKKQYDTKMREDLARMTEKMKVDFKYRLEIRLEEQKSKMLSKQLDLVNTVTGSTDREELIQLRTQRDRIDQANLDLEKALEKSNKELERLRHEASSSKKKGWWPF